MIVGKGNVILPDCTIKHLKNLEGERLNCRNLFYMQEHFQIPVNGCTNTTNSEAMTNFKNKMERYKIKTNTTELWSPSSSTVSVGSFYTVPPVNLSIITITMATIKKGN